MDINAQSAKIKELAQTLRKNGLAGSDSEAMRMAETMTTTEDRVNKNFEEKKSSMVRNYDFEKAKQNGAATYGSNPSRGIQSNIENAASAIGYRRTTEPVRVPEERVVQAPVQNMTVENNSIEQKISPHSIQEESENISHTWEKEEATQVAKPAPVSPSFNTNGGINDAINNVQERFAQQSAQQVNPELPMGLTLSDAASSLNEARMTEKEVNRDVPEVQIRQEVPVQQAPSPTQENVASVVQERSIDVPVMEEIQQAPAQQENMQREPQQIPLQQEAIQREPQVAAEQTIHTEEVQQASTQQETMQREPEVAVENQASVPQERSVEQEHTPPRQESAPIVEQSLPRPEVQREVQQAPAWQESIQRAPEQVATEQSIQEVSHTEEAIEDIVEKTQEMPSNPSFVRDTSKYAEAKISLADVFNVNNNKRM